MDTERRADANYHANGFALSAETCDHYKGGTYTNPPLTGAQVRSVIRFFNWAADTHSIPRRRCPAWDAGGFGYHSMWGAPSQWTPAAGKTCPNPNRIRQFNEIILPAVKAGRVEEDWFDMATEADLEAVVRKVLFDTTFPSEIRSNTFASKANATRDKADAIIAALQPTGDSVAADILRRVSVTDEILAAVESLQTEVAAIKAQLEGPAPQ